MFRIWRRLQLRIARLHRVYVLLGGVQENIPRQNLHRLCRLSHTEHKGVLWFSIQTSLGILSFAKQGGPASSSSPSQYRPVVSPQSTQGRMRSSVVPWQSAISDSPTVLTWNPDFSTSNAVSVILLNVLLFSQNDYSSNNRFSVYSASIWFYLLIKNENIGFSFGPQSYCCFSFCCSDLPYVISVRCNLNKGMLWEVPFT